MNGLLRSNQLELKVTLNLFSQLPLFQLLLSYEHAIFLQAWLPFLLFPFLLVVSWKEMIVQIQFRKLPVAMSLQIVAFS